MTESKPETTFKKLVRSLSRSSPRTERPPARDMAIPGGGSTERSSSKPRTPYGDGQRSAGLATSPPPDSYFPPPSRTTLQDDEASGRARHPDSLGARADAVGASAQGAPGVSFAPSPSGRQQRPVSEVEPWNPAPRRSQSQRSRPANNGTSGGGGALERRARAGTTGSGPAFKDEKETLAYENGDSLGPAFDARKAVSERRGVQLEDKPLSRSTSVKRAASAVKRAVEKVGFVPVEKADGEKRVLILVADGSEEIEVMAPLDIFVRASLSPVLVSVSPAFSPSQSLPYITLSRGAKILADTQFETLQQKYKDDFDAVVIPGGAKGAERLSGDKAVQELVWSFYESGKLVGMICAGSLAAKSAGIAEGSRITSHPSVKGELEKLYNYSEDRVVVDKNLVTSRGPGTAIEFALAMVEILAGKAKRDEVAGPMML
ncbi:DJ-1 [Meredithblackwellia eburnea MCA 4105]